MITNPFDDDKSFDWVREKWGRPKVLQPKGIGFWYQCAVCEASWVGPKGDWCDWCHERWIAKQASEHEKLLFPEFVNWGQSFARLSPIDQEVWASTRGFRGDYQSGWLVKLKESLDHSAITLDEFTQALERFKKWKMTLQSKPFEES